MASLQHLPDGIDVRASPVGIRAIVLDVVAGTFPAQVMPPGRKLTGWRWVFLSRQTGGQGVVAWPNVPLWVWIASAIARRMPFVDDRFHIALNTMGSVALVLWAVGEMWRGVSPFRRALGFAVLLGVVVSVIR